MYYIDKKFIDKPFPCNVGDYVHTTLIRGCYRVVSVSDLGFRIMKNRKERLIAWKYFYCLKGQSPIRNVEKDRLRKLVEFAKYIEHNVL